MHFYILMALWRLWLLMKKFLFIPTLTIFLIMGCTAQYTKNTVETALQEVYLIPSPEPSPRQWVLPRTVSIYVPLPKNKWSMALRRRLKEDLALALNQTFADVKQSDQERSLQEALTDARVNNINYVLYPQLSIYQNKISSLIELDEDFEDYDDYAKIGFDRFSVLLKLYDVNSGALIDNTQLKSSSGLVSISRATPANLFQKAFMSYAESLVSVNVE